MAESKVLIFWPWICYALVYCCLLKVKNGAAAEIHRPGFLSLSLFCCIPEENRY